MPASPSETVALAASSSAPLAENRRHAVFLGVAGLGLLAQGWLLPPPAASTAERLVGALVLALPVPALLGWGGRRPAGWLRAAVLAGALGGLAMLLGRRIDGASSGAAEFCVPLPRSGQPGVSVSLDWGTALMLAACLLCCLWVCPAEHPLSRWRSWGHHGSCLLAMWFGMILGVGLLRLSGCATFDGMILMHGAMVLGMMAGAAGMHWTLYPQSRHA